MGAGDFIKKMLGDPSSPRHDRIESTLNFMQLDTDGMRKRLDLDAKGRERGERNSPASDTTGFDDVETEIITVMNSEKDLAHNQYLHARAVMVDRANSYNFLTRLLEIGAVSDSAIADFQKAIQNGSNFLFQERRKLLQLHDAITKFKEKHHLDRPAYYPESRVLKFAIVAVMFLIESAVNATFLAEGDNLYLIGGLGKALGITFINVAISFMIGWHITRWIMHRSWFAKITSFLLTAAWIGGVFVGNLGVAQFRLASSGPDAEHAAGIAIQNLLTMPFNLPDIVAWVLFLMGFFFALIALGDGFTMDDSYPGYGPLSRALDGAERDYAQEKEGLLEELEDIKRSAERKMVDCGRDINAWQGGYRNLVARSETLRQKFISHLDHVEHVGNALLQAYRGENMRRRTTPAPKRFDMPWKMERPDIEMDDTAVREAAGQIDSVLGRCEAEIKGRREAMLSAYQKAISEYRRIEQMVGSEFEVPANG